MYVVKKSPVYDDNSFNNAMLENMRLEQIFNEKKARQKNFETNLKQRLKDYKLISKTELVKEASSDNHLAIPAGIKNDIKKRVEFTRKAYGKMERENIFNREQSKLVVVHNSDHRQGGYEMSEKSLFVMSTVGSSESEQKICRNLKRTHKKSKSPIDHYIENLKKLVKEKYLNSNIDVPRLCQCNDSDTFIWKTDWETCANNCPFYNNPKGKQILFK